jgi:hypothetical protein
MERTSMTGNRDTQTSNQPKPNPDLKSLGKLVGTWTISGEAHGQIRFEWMEGGFFLIQHVDLKYYGRRIKGIEVIGHYQRLGEEPSKEIRSRFYSSNDGLTLDYVYQLVGNTLKIWFGDKSSNNRFVGRFSPDGNGFSGKWKWPGGGYSVTGTRSK